MTTGIVAKAGLITKKDGKEVYLIMIEANDMEIQTGDFVEVKEA